MEPQERSVDKAAQKMIAKMNKAGQKNAWDRLTFSEPWLLARAPIVITVEE